MIARTTMVGTRGDPRTRRRVRRGSGLPPGTGALGMRLFLVSLSVLFVASLVAYGVVRSRAGGWPPAGAPPLPRLLLVSTALLAACSAAAELAVRAIRAGLREALLGWLGVTGAVAAAFLVVQTVAWVRFFDAASFHTHLYEFTFYMLTGLHAAHVLGGVAGLAVVLVRAWRGDYTWAWFPGVRHLATYWHFLGVVWLVLYATLWIGG